MYLRCGYNGVPAPVVQWFHNNILLMDRLNGITINTNHNTTSILKDEVERTSGGTYTCRGVYTIGGLDWWTGLVDWTTGLIDFHLKRTFRGSIMRCNGGK